MKTPEILGVVTRNTIPPPGRGTDGKAVSARPWKRLTDQIFALDPDCALMMRLAPTQDRPWTMGRLYTQGKRSGGKIKLAVREYILYAWWETKPEPKPKEEKADAKTVHREQKRRARAYKKALAVMARRA